MARRDFFPESRWLSPDGDGCYSTVQYAGLATPIFSSDFGATIAPAAQLSFGRSEH